jgi:excisionase family DNA binding protein
MTDRRPRRAFTAAEDAYICAQFAKQTYGQIAAALPDCPYDALQLRIRALIRAGRLDERTRCYLPHWTQADVDYLKTHWGRLPDERVAKHLRRDVGGCYQKARRLGITRRQNFLSAAAVARIFRVDGKTVGHWITHEWLHATKSTVAAGNNNRCWHIDEADLATFLRKHPDQYERARIDPDRYGYWRQIAEETAAAAPDRARVRPARFNRDWTDADDRYLCAHWGVDRDADVAAHLERTIKGCQCRLIDISFSKRDARAGWHTKAEVAQLLGVSDTRVTRWIDLKLIKAHRQMLTDDAWVWLISPAEVARIRRERPDLVQAATDLSGCQVARQLGVPLHRLYEWIEAGRLPARKSATGRGTGSGARYQIRPADLATFRDTQLPQLQGPWLTPQEAAQALGVSLYWMRIWLTSGLLPATRRRDKGRTHWRIRQADLEQFRAECAYLFEEDEGQAAA